MDDPSLRQLRYFVLLAESGQYLRAAQRAGISQPSLSLQIGNLEDRLRLKLVERNRRGVVLTPEGREVLARARRVLEEVRGLTELAGTLKSGAAGTIRLGSTPTIGPYLLPRILQRLHADYPDLKLVVRDGPPRELLDDLMAGAHDLILTQLPVPPGAIETRRLFREPLSLAVARDHPLAGAGAVGDADLRGLDVLTLSSAYALHGQIAALCQETGARLREDYEGTSLDALRQMAAMNMGVTFLPSLYVRSEVAKTAGDVVVLPFRRGRLHRSVGLVWRSASAQTAGFDRFAEAAEAVIARDFKGVVQREGGPRQARPR